MSDFTPSWKMIQCDPANSHIALQWVTKKIYERSENSLPVSEIDEININSALELNFLVINDGKISFSDSTVRDEYLVRHVVDLALLAWDDLEIFTNTFNKIFRYKFDFPIDSPYKLEDRVLLLLAKEYKKDISGKINEIAKQIIQQQKNNSLLSNLYDSFCAILPELDIHYECLVTTLESVSHALYEAYVVEKIYPAIDKLAAQSQETANALYKVFLSCPDLPIAGLAVNVLLGLAKFDLQDAHHRALELTNSEHPTLRRIGIISLGKFHYGSDDSHSLLSSTIERLEVFLTTPNKETDYILAQAYGDLLSQTEQASEAILKLSIRQEIVAQNSVVYVLFRQENTINHYPWYKKALLNLAKTPFHSPEKLRYLDYCIDSYARNEPDTAFEVVESLAFGWGYNQFGVYAKLPDFLNCTFRELSNHHLDALRGRITHWFASNKKYLHITASDVYRYFNSIPLAETNGEIREVLFHKKTAKTSLLKLSKQVLDTLDEQTFVSVIYRLAGYIKDASSLAALLISVLASKSNSPDIIKLVTDLLWNHVLYNYPKETGDYLKYRSEAGDLTEIEQQVIQTALARSNAYFEARHNLPRLKELQPPSQRVYLLQIAQWKHDSAIIEAAKQKSVFFSTSVKIPLKYGCAVSVEQDGSFTEPSKLTKFYGETEIAQGELINPLGQYYQRLEWQNAGMLANETNTEDAINQENDK
jgi:hypothetical protein